MNESTSNPADKLHHLATSLDRTALVMSSADRMIDHYRHINKEKENEIAKLKEELRHSFEERRHEGDLFNRYRNSTRRSFRESPKTVYDIHRTSSTPKIYSSKKHQLSSPPPPASNFETTDMMSSPPSYGYHSTPIHDDNRDEIHFHLKRIHEQIENDRGNRKLQNKEMEELTKEMKTLKEEMKKGNTSLLSSTSVNQSLTSSSDQSFRSIKKTIGKQQAEIDLLTEQLRKKEREAEKVVLTNQNQVLIQTNQLKLMEEKLNKEEGERMKILKEYTVVQEKLAEADRERSELLFALSDVKAEARSILLAYEETTQSLPELKSLLEVSAKQKTEFSYQITKLQTEIEEHKNENRRLKEKVNDVTLVVKETTMGKEMATSKLEEYQSRCHDIACELKDSKEMLHEAKIAYDRIEHEKKQLQDKAVATLKSYRARSRKSEKELAIMTEKYSIAEKELSIATMKTKELEIENVKQTQRFEELSTRMEELQGNMKQYVEKYNHLSNEKNKLELSVSHANDVREENFVMLSEREKLLAENSNISSALNDEKERRIDFETLCREYYEETLTLKEDYSTLKSNSEKERNELIEQQNEQLKAYNSLQEQFKLLATDNKHSNETNASLLKQIELSTDQTKTTDKKYDDVCRALEDQTELTDQEVTKSNKLTQKLETFTVEIKKLRNMITNQEAMFTEKIKSLETSLFARDEENITLKEYLRNAQLDTTSLRVNMKKIIDILRHDVGHLLQLLRQDADDVEAVKDVPDDVIAECEPEVNALRERIFSCVTVAKILLERYDGQRSLITKAKDRIKSQLDDIHNLAASRDQEIKTLEKEIKELEIERSNDKEVITNLERDNDSLKVRVNELTKDLEECTKALQKSLDLAKERKTVLNEIDILNMENKERLQIDENLFRANDEIEVIAEQLSEAKISFNELKQNGMVTSDYAERVIDSFQSISPTKKRRMLEFGTPYMFEL